MGHDCYLPPRALDYLFANSLCIMGFFRHSFTDDYHIFKLKIVLAENSRIHEGDGQSSGGPAHTERNDTAVRHMYQNDFFIRNFI